MAYSAGKRGTAAYNRYARKKKEDEERPLQPDEPQESAPAPVSEPQQSEAAEPAQQERKPFTMPEVTKRDQERGYTRTVQEYADQTSVKLIKTGEMVLPEAMEEHREILEESNREGRMGNGTSFGYTQNEISVDVGSIKDDRHLFFFGTTLTDDAQRRKLYEKYAADNGIDLQDLMYRAEKTLGVKAFDFPQSAKGQLEYAGVYDVSGNPLDMNTARAAQVDAAIKMIPPGDMHDMAVKARIELFGWIDKDELKFMDSADLTETEYKKQVEAFNESFTFSDGATEENTEAYVAAMHDVLDGYENPRVQKQMLAALAKSYEERTGVKAMTPEEVLALEAQAAADSEGEDDPGFVGKLMNMFFGAAKGKGKAEKAPAQAQDEQDEFTPSEAQAEQGEFTPSEATEEVPASSYAAGGSSGGGSYSGGAASSYAAAGSAPNIQPAILKEPEAQAEAAPEVQGPVYRPNNAAQYQNKIEYDPEMTDAQALAYYNRGATLDERNLEQIRWFLNNKNTQGLNYGTGMYSYIPGAGGARGAVDKFAYYGNSIGSAATMLASGSLPEEIAGTATLALGKVIDEIDRIVADPGSGVSIPAGQNMYEYVLSLPQYEGLASQVAAVSGTDVQVKRAYAEQAILEKEAHAAQIERDKAAIRSGTATREALDRVAADSGNDYVNIGNDETRAVYYHQMSEWANFFSDDGAFWSGGSAAAQEGLNLRAANGRNGQSYALYKSGLKAETLRIIDEYTEAAAKMGMSLKEYLDSAGIGDLDTIIGIAYSSMQEKGSAYAGDREAQDAAAAIATTDVGLWESTKMGAQHGVESYVADFMQTNYMALDAADYNLRRADLMNEYRGKYGEEQAARMYYADLMALIDSGTLSQETSADLLDHMNRARNIFDVAYEIDPGFLRGIMRTGREELQKDVEALETVKAMLPEDERMAFNAVSGLTYTLTGGAVSTLTGGATGSALVGSALGWGTTEYANAYDANRAAGMSPGMAGWVSLGNAALTTATNMGGVGSQMDTLFGGTAYQEFKKALQSRSGAALMKAMGKEVISHAHEEGMEELAELAAGTTFDLMDKEFLALDAGAEFSLSRMFTNIVSSLEETDMEALYKEAVTSYGVGAVYGGVFSLAGVGRQAIAARRGMNMQKSYESVSMAMQMADGEIPFTEENVGKIYAQLQKDLDDPRFRKWIDSGALAAREQSATVTAILAGMGEDIRKSAVAEIQKAAEYDEKARAAKTASGESEGRWWEIRQRVLDGDAEAIPALEGARMAWAKAQTTANETEAAAQKAKDSAADKAGSWIKQAMAEGRRMKSAEMQRYTAQIGALRTAVADVLAERYAAEEAAKAAQMPVTEGADKEIEYAQGYVFREEDAAYDEAPDIQEEMSDEEIDSEITEVTAAISEAESRVADITSRSEELGLTGESIQEIVGQEITPLSRRKERITEREIGRFNDLFERMQTALDADDEAAYGELEGRYAAVQARLEALGVNTESLIMRQYGIAEDEANAAAEQEQAKETQRADAEKQERLTESLTRRMEETAIKIEQNAPARKYLRDHDIYINESQAADILSAEGLKSIANFNFKYGTKLTTDRAKGAMPLDGHVMSDINAEAAGSVDETADPVSEMLRIVQTGKQLAAEQKQEKAEARELTAKRKEAEKNRQSRVESVSKRDSGIDALAAGTEAKEETAQTDAAASTASTPAQGSGKTRSKKLEGSALKAISSLAKDIGVGLRVRSGQRFQSRGARMGKDVLGYYTGGNRNAIVRATEAGRVSVSGHEIGHAVQEQLGLASNQQMINSWQSTFGATDKYTPDQYDHEAFAEFFWRYLTGREAAAAYAGDAYVDAFENALRQKKMHKAVAKAQRAVSSYINSEAEAKIRAKIVNASDVKADEDTTLARKIEISLIDDTAAAEDFDDVIRSRTGGKVLGLEDSLRETIRFNRRARARAYSCLTDAMVDQNGNVVYKSLKQAFADAGLKGKDFDLFWEYELVKHSLDRDKAKKAKNQVFDEDTLPTAEREALAKKLESEHPEFEKANREFQEWRHKFMETYLVHNGFLGENGSLLLNALDALYPNYVPTYRARTKSDKRATVGGKTYQMRRASGSTEDIINPFDSFVGMVNSIVQMVAENDSKRKFADLYDRNRSYEAGKTGPGVGLFANEITQDMKRVSVSTETMRERVERILDDIGTDPEIILQISDIIGDEKVEYRGTGRVNLSNVITIRESDGSKRYFEVYNPELFELLAATNTPDQAGILDGIAKATRMMSMLTTGSNPVFGMTNFMRDFQNSVNYGSWAATYADGAVKWLQTLWDVVHGGEATKEYDALGGGGWTAYDTKTKKGAEQVRSEVFGGYSTSSAGRTIKTAGRALWSVATFEKLNEVIEKTSRVAEYKFGKHDRTTTEGRIEAFLAAQDVTTDFSRRGNGRIARDMKNLIPFFNASMQGVYRNARQFSAQESDRAGIRFAKNVINCTLASCIANAILINYLDDEEREEFYHLSDEVKAKHMFLPNIAPEVFGNSPLIRIPIDQNPISYATNAAVANFIWKGENDNEFVIEMAAAADVIMDTLNPVGSTIIDPILAIRSNKNWYGSNIVPSYLESYDETNQYTEETPTPFIAFSKGLSGIGVKISPMTLQYMAEQYTGYIGQTIIPALPSEKNQRGIVSGILGSLVATARKRITSDPLASNDVVGTVYDSFNELQEIYKAGSSKRDFEIEYLNPSLTGRERKRAIDEADELIHSGGEIYEAKKEISAGYDKIDQINDRDDLSDEEKYILIQRVRRDMVETALDVQEIVNDYNVRYKYNGILPRFIAEMFLE